MCNVASGDWKMGTHQVHVDADVPMTQVEDMLPFANTDKPDPDNSALCGSTLLLH
jgi:hypothetical protein